MVIRNAVRPEGILISVDGRPLDPSGGQRGAVAVFHDITELRRYETDLAVFAGVVAHDLKAPLAVIRGYCEAAEEALEDDLGHARHALLRIARSVDRMSGMIDTLLAYSTARDAPLRSGPVDLGGLVTEVVQDRVAHLPAGDRPAVTIRALPWVRADPVMLRHVLENLVGNALKYVPPAAAVRLEVSAVFTGSGWVRIEVADRGIGIPDHDKPAVFDRFHRAHAADGYAGTGLGLAICKRIVERHGGEIGVTDNPGGGSVFHFTLPLEANMDPHEDDDEDIRTKLERALAERAAMEDVRLPGMTALPAAEPSAHEPSAARLRSPVPDHRPAD
jgi:signal transduction histidine kinase